MLYYTVIPNLRQFELHVQSEFFFINYVILHAVILKLSVKVSYTVVKLFSSFCVPTCATRLAILTSISNELFNEFCDVISTWVEHSFNFFTCCFVVRLEPV